MNAGDVRKELLKFSSEDRAKKNAYFFKTGIGQYSEGEIFIGVRTPEIRLVACLLFTSDAADERSSVDLGGRRIIKKKKKRRDRSAQYHKKKRYIKTTH